MRKVLLTLAAAALSVMGAGSDLAFAQAERIEIDDASIPVQVDGEIHTQTPMRFEVAPGALNVVIPRGTRSPLFSDEQQHRAQSLNARA